VNGLVLRQLLVPGAKSASGSERSPLCTPPCTGALVYHNGPVQQTPTTYVVYWQFTSGADPSGEQSYLTSFLNGMGGTTYLNTLTQYSSTDEGYIDNPSSQLAGTWVDTTNAVPTTPSETDIADEAARAAAHFGYAAEANYIVATPTGHNTTSSGTVYCGEHGSTSTSSGTIRYTYIPYQTDAGTHCPENWVNSGSAGLLDGVSIVAGHEVAETQTDPSVGQGWTESGNEIADKCAAASLSANVTFGTGTFAVQKLWSNAANDCVLTTASPTVNCTADGYGYCGYIHGGATSTVFCTIGHHTYSGISGDAWYHLYHNNSYTAANAGLYVESFSMDASCNQVTSWDPGEPSVVTGDPNLP
jgi:serine protease